ncbi:acetoacetate decarboxylase family protein [Nostoc sp. FACHB-152]|uniref:acetoacetate decarboxylase family protein n=1 Tax=unclassified Nostoc TaxID=2593658 RepID=UPI001682C445|nr:MULTISPECIES: acetoacetate decarboxylase family protein [unclassified Nostoc]MBD2447060.1 acetoacetate decarboxylase family protein [Nostoc sp. FACHB-152]MBD2470343.1 acetoacetate decarboxylase family protein [Nostoc sp. FACHB-145]
MSYPATPWTLCGKAIASVHLVNINQVRSLIPSEFQIFSVWPGKTLAAVYLSEYCQGSVLEYSELIVIPAVVSYQNKIGAWVSHIYVDNADSVAGGREIWGLPKELAHFTWENDKRVTVRQGDRNLCTLNYKPQNLAWRQSLTGHSFSVRGAELIRFSAQCEAAFGLISSSLEIPAESPFSGFNLGQPFLTVRAEQMKLQVAHPEVVGQKAGELIYR